MKKRTDMHYSMTKKQRKNLSESDKKEQNIELSEEEKIALEKEKAEKKAKTKRITSIVMIAVSVVLSIALIASAIAVYFIRQDSYVPVGNPIAKIRLSNNMELEFELLQDKAPIATTNFIFLSKIGFFDNTVIQDISYDTVRFSGYEKGYTGYNNEENKDSLHRVDNLNFIREANKYFKKYNIEYFKDIKLNGYKNFENENQIFFYRLAREKDASSTISSSDSDISIGDLMFYYSDSSTMMQILATDNPQFNIRQGANGSPVSFSSLTKFGRSNNEKTKENLRQLRNLPTVDNEYSYWHYPESEIVIERIEISNISEKKWKDILNKTGIDVYLESGIDSERDSYTSVGHTNRDRVCNYH